MNAYPKACVSCKFYYYDYPVGGRCLNALNPSTKVHWDDKCKYYQKNPEYK